MMIGEKIRQLREGKYTQEELAEKINVHNVTISKWENGTQSPNGKRIADLARVLGTTTEYLLGDSDTPQSPAKESPIKKANNFLVYERNGERLELPPTEEGYAIIREIARMIAGREGATVAPA